MSSERKGMRRLGKDALVAEATSVLAENPQASMIEIANEIGVGRTTLYRHFGDRETLIAEVARQGARQFADALVGARPHVGPGLDAVERVCAQLFTIPDTLTLMFADNPIITDDSFVEADSAPSTEGDPLEAVVRRGQADGTIAPDLPVEWAAMYVFLTIGSGHLFDVSSRSGRRDPGNRAAALDLTIRAVRKTLSAT